MHEFEKSVEKVWERCNSCGTSMRDRRYIRVVAPAGFDGRPTRREYCFKTRNAAREFRLSIERWKAEKKAPADSITITETDKRWVAYLRAHLSNLELLPEIITHWERTAKPIARLLTVEELCQAFVSGRENKRLGIKTLAEDRYVARKLRTHLGNRMAHELSTPEIRSFLDSAKSSESLEQKFYKVGSLIFSFAKEQRIVCLNPFLEIARPKVSYSVPELLEPVAFEKLLVSAEQVVPDLAPYLIMAGFCGLRRSELVRLNRNDQVVCWEDFNWQKKFLVVRNEVAKQTKKKMGNRRFPPMEPALIHWLEPYKKETGPLVPFSDGALRRRMKKLRDSSGIDVPNNALRHSYASYWLARSTLAGVGELAKRMGNSEAVARRHYLEPLTPEEGEAWFGLRRRALALTFGSSRTPSLAA
jgi:integrase